ncbi:MAG: putative rane protein [Paenibacillus sp.]|jgi:uncharacterized membrane protein|nr:putative rane protein [Paenibacillus sp.]
MIPFYVLIVVSALAYAAGAAGVPYLYEWDYALKAGVTAMFLLTASAHWGKKRASLIRMVPPSLPKPERLVTLTGMLEIIGVAGLWIPALSPYAGTGLALMLLAMFPANVYAAKMNGKIGGRNVTPLPVRTVLQVIFIAAVLFAAWN